VFLVNNMTDIIEGGEGTIGDFIGNCEKEEKMRCFFHFACFRGCDLCFLWCSSFCGSSSRRDVRGGGAETAGETAGFDG
jgi:hypothetical protein